MVASRYPPTGVSKVSLRSPIGITNSYRISSIAWGSLLRWLVQGSVPYSNRCPGVLLQFLSCTLHKPVTKISWPSMPSHCATPSAVISRPSHGEQTLFATARSGSDIAFACWSAGGISFPSYHPYLGDFPRSAT